MDAVGRSGAKRPIPSDPTQQPLLPGLPDNVAQVCLSRLRPSILFSVCRSWRTLIHSPSFPSFPVLYALLWSSTAQHNGREGGGIHFLCFDPIYSRWRRLPPLPPGIHLRPLLTHPSFLSRTFPIQSVSAAGSLVVLAATNPDFLPAVTRPLVFSPRSQQWAVGPPLSVPRRWCVAGAVGGAVVVASGVGSRYQNETARSVEKLDLTVRSWRWEKMGPLRDARFSREAIDAVGWRGKLCVVNAAKEGALYDVVSDTWEAMPEGMIAGWRGPAASMDEDVIYAVDESRGCLNRYDSEGDRWERVTVSQRLRQAEHMAAGGGRVCVVCGGAIVVVDVTGTPARLWPVDRPPGFLAVALHVLPRMSTWG